MMSAVPDTAFATLSTTRARPRVGIKRDTTAEGPGLEERAEGGGTDGHYAQGRLESGPEDDITRCW